MYKPTFTSSLAGEFLRIEESEKGTLNYFRISDIVEVHKAKKEIKIFTSTMQPVHQVSTTRKSTFKCDSEEEAYRFAEEIMALMATVITLPKSTGRSG